MYILMKNNRVINGPRDWHYLMFMGALEKLGVEFQLPTVAPSSLPLTITDDIKIYKAEYRYPEINPKIQQFDGPFWTFENDKAIGSFIIKNKPIEFVKSDLKKIVAEQRWRKENSGTTLELQGQTVTIFTDRDTRNIPFQKYFLMTDDEKVGWKFPETWLILSREEVGIMLKTIEKYVETCFIWEAQKNFQIDACVTLDQLDQIDLEIEPRESENIVE